MSYDSKALGNLFAQSTAPSEIVPVVQVERTEQTAIMQLETPPDSESVVKIPISELTDYPKQFFRPYSEDKIKKFETSIRENGIIQPLLIRPVDGTYQIVCGHNRRNAAALAGFDKVPCIIEEMTDDEADIKLVETNLQSRSGLLPSEKGFAYRVKLEALKHQDQRVGLSAGTTVPIHSRAELSKQVDESERQIQNYIRLTYLIAPLLESVDNGVISVKAAVELSLLTEPNQQIVFDYFFVNHKISIDEQLAKRLKEESRISDLSDDSIKALLPSIQGRTVSQSKKLTIPTKPLLKLLDASALTKDVEKEILAILIEYFEKKKTSNQS